MHIAGTYFWGNEHSDAAHIKCSCGPHLSRGAVGSAPLIYGYLETNVEQFFSSTVFCIKQNKEILAGTVDCKQKFCEQRVCIDFHSF